MLTTRVASLTLGRSRTALPQGRTGHHGGPVGEEVDPADALTAGVALLEPGKKVAVYGVLRNRKVKPRKGRSPIVEGLLERPNASSIPVTWWEETEAPPEGSRVSVAGTVRTLFDVPYVSADETRRLRQTPGEAPHLEHANHVLLRYLYECVEAEAGLDTIIDPKDDRILILEGGRDPAVTRDADHDDPVFLTGEDERRWFRDQREAGRESVLLGYPAVVGSREENGVPQTRMAPLFIVECEWDENEQGVRLWRKDPGTEELAVPALELLGLGPEERERLAELLEGSSQVVEGTSPRDRLQLRVNVLQETGLIQSVPAIDPESLSRIGGPISISNSILALPLDRSPYVRSLLFDLANLGDLPPEVLQTGPLGVILRGDKTQIVTTTVPEPTVLPSNHSQDVATTGSRRAVLSVVTGPPGTGKSQIIVNAIAAAVCAGETVLVASKNNQAVDVVTKRLRDLNLELPVVRTGNRRYRQEAMLLIKEALGRKVSETSSLGTARAAWDAAQIPVRQVHEQFSKRRALESRIRTLEEGLAAVICALPPGIFTELSRRGPAELLARLVRSQQPPPLLLRVISPFSRHWRYRRLAKAKRFLSERLSSSIMDLLALNMNDAKDTTLTEGSLANLAVPLRAARCLLEKVMEGVRLQESLHAETAALNVIPTVESLERELAHLDASRRAAGRALVDACWLSRNAAAPATAREEASKYLQLLEKLPATEQALARIDRVFHPLLELLPVWLVSSLSARGSFPLTPGLFDLLIVDEASQSDVASLVPLLFRAKRAMIVGDSRQLTHVTRLSSQRDERIALEVGLDGAQRAGWSYVRANGFGLAAGHIDGPATVLEQHFRSHPAIIEFCNESLYDSALVVCTDPKRWAGQVGLIWIDVAGKVIGTSSGSRYNDAEAKRVVEELLLLQDRLGLGPRSVGIVSPYRAQADLIKKHLGALPPGKRSMADVGTAHSFQGDERDVMIYSPVISGSAAEKKGLLAARPELINVAISRASRLLVVVGDRTACLNLSTSLLRNLAEYSMALDGQSALTPFELRFAKSLNFEGVETEIGKEIDGYRTGVMVRSGARVLAVDCDGDPFDEGISPTPERDARIAATGARQLRFSPRRLRRDLDGCVAEALEKLGEGN